MDRASIVGALDYRGDWEAYWLKNELTPSFTEVKVKQVSPEVFEEGDTVIINSSSVPNKKEKFSGVIIFPQESQGYYLMDKEGDIWLSELLVNYDIDDCLVHYQSAKMADATTEEGEGSSRPRSPTVESQREGSITPFLGSLDNSREANNLEPIPLWHQVKYSESTSTSELIIAKETNEMLKAEISELKKKQQSSEEHIHSLSQNLEQCKSELSQADTKYQAALEEKNRLENKTESDRVKIKELEKELIYIHKQKESQKHLIAQFHFQKDQSVNNLKGKISDLSVVMNGGGG